MKCSECGTDVSDESIEYCPNCGTKVRKIKTTKEIMGWKGLEFFKPTKETIFLFLLLVNAIILTGLPCRFYTYGSFLETFKYNFLNFRCFPGSYIVLPYIIIKQFIIGPPGVKSPYPYIFAFMVNIVYIHIITVLMFHILKKIKLISSLPAFLKITKWKVIILVIITFLIFMTSLRFMAAG